MAVKIKNVSYWNDRDECFQNAVMIYLDGHERPFVMGKIQTESDARIITEDALAQIPGSVPA